MTHSMTVSLKHLAAAGVLVAGVAACDIDPEIAPPFAPTGTGTVAGQLFFDANGNNQFDLLGGDTAITAATINLTQRGDSARVIATTTPDAQGRFSFRDVPAGTHEVRARIAGGALVVCVPVGVSVFIAEQAFATTPVRASCRIDIAVAEQRTQGSIVTVGGIVTAAPGVYRANNLYLQDVTGGMQAFNIPGGTSSGILEGDSIEVTGPLGQFGQELQISPVTAFRIYTRGRKVDTLTYTVRQIRAAYTEKLALATPIGQLVRVRGVRVIAPATLTGTAGAGGTNGTIVQGADTITFRLDVAQNTQANLTALSNAAGCYDLVGPLGLNGSTLQLKPRRPEDIMAVACASN